jgi:hypothetical protein
MTPDLQRIVEALKACRSQFDWEFGDFGMDNLMLDGVVVCSGTETEIWAYIDARCAEAMVRAIREPSNRALEAGLHGYMNGVLSCWQSVADAILGETQP